jgi:hypothetical protein
MTTIKLPYETGMDLGLGVNSTTDEVRGQAVTWPGAPAGVTDAGGQVPSFDLQLIESSDDLMRVLGIDVSASGSYAMFSGSAHMDLYNSCAFHQYSLFVYAHATVLNSFQLLKNVTLEAGPEALLTNGKVDQFIEDYGDTFINGIQTGGETFAIFEITTSSSTERDSIHADLTAKGDFGIGKASVSAQFGQTAEAATAGRVVNFHTKSFGGNAITFTSFDDIVKQLNAYPTSVSGAQSVPYAMQAQDYGTLGVALPGAAELESQRLAIGQMAQQHNMLTTTLNNIRYIQNNPSQFIAPDFATLGTAADTITDDLNTLQSQSLACAKDATQCNLPKLRFRGITLPTRIAAVEIITPGLPDVVCGQPYSANLQAQGGQQKYIWSLASGALPTGITLNADGTLTGTATPFQDQVGPLTFTVIDQSQLKDTRTVALRLARRRKSLSSTQSQSGSGHTQDYIKTYTVSADQDAQVDAATVQLTVLEFTKNSHIVNKVVNPTNVTFTLFTPCVHPGSHSGEITVELTFDEVWP